MVRAIPRWLPGTEEAVAAVFARGGFDGARMEELAAAAGIPRATLYYHFSGKDDVLAWLLRSTLETLGEAVVAATAGPGDARRRLAAVIRAQLAVMGRQPLACQVLLAQLERTGRLPEINALVIEAFHAPVIRLLADGAEDGSLRPAADPVRTAGVIFGAVTIPAFQSLIVDPVFQEEAVATAALELVFSGLKAS